MHDLWVFLVLLQLLENSENTELCCKNCCMACEEKHARDSDYGSQIKMQIIVTEQELKELVTIIASSYQFRYKIKYALPMIQSYVIEADGLFMDKLNWWRRRVGDNYRVEADSIISAQMKRAAPIIHLEAAHNRGIYGEGVGVAVLDTGVFPHPDLTTGRNRIIAFYDVLNGRRYPYDDNGHGTHVCGIIAGNGYESNGEYVGVAPRCNIIGVKVLNHKGNGNVSDVLAGLQWVINNKERYNIRIVNISVGTASTDSIDENSALVKGVNAVWDAGIVVVVAAGNNGPKPKSISTPGISRKVITVGASDDDVPVDLSGNKAKDYSGRGPTNACIKKPDVVAPGSNIVSCNVGRARTNFSLFGAKRDGQMYTVKSGTSMATPLVSGAIALLVSVYPEMTTQEVKLRIKNSSTDLGQPWNKQGWGLLNIKELLR